MPEAAPCPLPSGGWPAAREPSLCACAGTGISKVRSVWPRARQPPLTEPGRTERKTPSPPSPAPAAVGTDRTLEGRRPDPNKLPSEGTCASGFIQEACLPQFCGVDHGSILNTNDLGKDPKYFFWLKAEVLIPNKLCSVQDSKGSMEALECPREQRGELWIRRHTPHTKPRGGDKGARSQGRSVRDTGLAHGSPGGPSPRTPDILGSV